MAVTARVGAAGAVGVRVPMLALTAAVGFVGALAVRMTQLHSGLLYPDGYQYLLMARGIAEHGRPETRLGPAGDLFVPSLDAAAKPLFPALVAIGDIAGVAPRTAAEAVTAMAAAAVVVLSALLALRITGSRTGAVVAGVLCLSSPSLGYWSGFAGPDPLAQALVLGAVLAAMHHRALPAGLLAAAAVCARPEAALPLLGVGLAALLVPRYRRAAGSGLQVALAAVAVVYLALRPPVELPTPVVALVGVTFVLAVTGFAAALWRWPRAAGAALLVLLAVALVGRAEDALGRADWPLFLLAFAAALVALRHPQTARAAGLVLLIAGSLTAVYLVKNPSSDRYLTNLLPAACVLVSIGSVGIAQRLRVPVLRVAGMGVAAAVALALTVVGGRERPGLDAFAALAPRLGPSGPPLVTAAPDAYGVLLPGRSVLNLEAGARGLILLDGAQRAYVPRVTVRGRTVRRLRAAPFFRWDGVVDDRAARLVDGVVVSAG
jgi:hypothetical protein